MSLKPLDNIKFAIINFAKPLVSKKLLNAIKALLNPCCVISITDATYDCGTEVLTLDITPARPSYAGFSGFAEVFTDAGTPGDKIFLGDGVISGDGKTITVEIPLVDAPVGADQIFTATIFLPTGIDNTTIGVYQVAVSTAQTIPAC